tara:strand:- start:242 stop:418 length:177 start_codon:yes stop_codon:yes gene_type:complete
MYKTLEEELHAILDRKKLAEDKEQWDIAQMEAQNAEAIMQGNQIDIEEYERKYHVIYE